MVSFWPFKSDETASFERTLSTLSSKIKRANVKQDRLRTASRRYTVLWTIYTSFAYLLACVILVLVTGWHNWGSVEFTVVAGSPVLIYSVRLGLAAFYEYRISSNQSYLNDLNRQREGAIDKFKTATKYNSTQELLEKYGAAPKSPSSEGSPVVPQHAAVQSMKPSVQPPLRTGLAPPATANIQRLVEPNTPQPRSHAQDSVLQDVSLSPQHLRGTSSEVRSKFTSGQDHNQAPSIASSPTDPTSTENVAHFAANAFNTSPPPQYEAVDLSQPQWYDRIMDLILGEDERKASNRLALICQYCRLVNGQAPPGVKTLQDIGRWRCAECRRWNGVESEMQQIARAAANGGNSIELIGEPGPAFVGDQDTSQDDLEKSDHHSTRSTDSEVGRRARFKSGTAEA